MSRIDELVQQLTPNGVEFKTLGEVGTFIRGNGLQKTDLASAGFPAIHYGQVHTYYGTWATETRSFVAPEFAMKLRQATPGDLIIATTSEDDEAVGKAVAWLGDGKAAVSGDAYIYQHSLDPKYVAYFFQSDQFQKQKMRRITGAKVRRISGESLGRIRVPVPPVELQQEIARVLDSFSTLESALESELRSELKTRQRQYAYCRDLLLTFGDDVRRMPMGAFGTMFGGLTGKTKADFSDGNARFVSYVNVLNNLAVDIAADNFVRIEPGERQRALQRGDILFTGSSETPDDVAMSSVVTSELSEPLYLNSFCIGFRLTDPPVLDPEFSKHLFRSGAMCKQLVRTANGVTRFNVSKARLTQVQVPIPAIHEQRRVAGLLDNLEALVNSLTDQLPAELRARRTQYKYYRNQLLTFEELSA